MIFEAGPFGEAQPEMPCLCLEAGPQASGWVPDGARPCCPCQSFDVSKSFMHEHIATLVSHRQSFYPEVCLCPQMALSANRFFVQSDTQDSCGFTTWAFQAYFLESKCTLPLRIMIEFSWLSWKEIESSSHFFPRHIQRMDETQRKNINSLGIWTVNKNSKKKQWICVCMCLHPAVPQILSGIEVSLWTDEYADGQFLYGSNRMDCPVSQIHRVFGIFWAGGGSVAFCPFLPKPWLMKSRVATMYDYDSMTW